MTALDPSVGYSLRSRTYEVGWRANLRDTDLQGVVKGSAVMLDGEKVADL